MGEADYGWAATGYNTLTGKQNPLINIWIAIGAWTMTESPTQKTPPVCTIIHARRLTILLAAIALVLAVFRVATGSHAQTNENNGTDILLYKTDDEWRSYDPRNRTEITFPDEALDPRFSQDGRVAFIRRDENDAGLYVFNPQMPDIAPVNISQTSAEDFYNSLSWSPDGRYLAFGLLLFHEETGNYHGSLNVWDGETVSNITPDIALINIAQNPTAIFYELSWSPDGRYLAFTIWRGASNYVGSLYVWDGETTTNIAPDDLPDFVREIDVDWSPDGRLAFTIEDHEEEDTTVRSEIYVWDGETTTNLSQNPTGADWGATWSDNGQLAFVSMRDDVEGIYVWDGLSFKDGSPDRDSFIHVARELQLYEFDPIMAEPIWTDEGFLGFLVIHERSSSLDTELVLWDMEIQEIARQFPVSGIFGGWGRLRNGQQVFSYFATASGRSYYLDVLDTRGRLLLSTIVDWYVWSSDGYLALCEFECSDSDRFMSVLSIWDGQEFQVVTKSAGRIGVQWQSGGRTYCDSSFLNTC